MSPAPHPALEQFRLSYEQSSRDAQSRNLRWTIASCPAPTALAEKLADLQLGEAAVYFSSGGDDETRGRAATYVGLGAFEILRLEGASRFADAMRGMQATFDTLHIPAAYQAHLRYFGGAAFNPGRDGAGPCWKNFGDACFILPRLIYVDEGERAFFLGIVSASLETGHDDRGAFSLLSAALECEDTSPESATDALHTVSSRDSAPLPEWKQMVHAIQGRIATGEVQKVVAARRLTIRLSAPPRLSGVIARLNAAAPLCARFALRIGQKTFIGATPERLIKRSGLHISTEALAGSIDARLPNAEVELLRSEKDQHEHAYVKDALSYVLTPLCSSLEISETPEIRALKHILHLRTRVSGTLSENTHVLTLVSHLHPTPAVGGLPKKEALEWISGNEPTERGWYAAPIGWVNCNGDGEFVVALRSALLAGDQAHIYAGAGIVAESNADAEYAETELKLSGMLGALGLAS